MSPRKRVDDPHVGTIRQNADDLVTVVLPAPGNPGKFVELGKAGAFKNPCAVSDESSF
jgi:hypothetical protein